MRTKILLLSSCLLVANTASIQAKYTTAKTLAAAYIVCTAIPLADFTAILLGPSHGESWIRSQIKKLGIPGPLDDGPAGSNWLNNRSTINYIFPAALAGIGALTALGIEYAISA